MRSRQKSIIKSSVRSSIEKLLDRARAAYDAGQQGRSKRYVKMAFDLLKKHRVRLPRQFRNSFCRKCLTLWVPGKTMVASYDRKNNCLRARCSCGHSKRL